MLPSMLSRLFFGEAKENEEDRVEKEEILKHTSFREETGDWLLISCGKEVGSYQLMTKKNPMPNSWQTAGRAAVLQHAPACNTFWHGVIALS